MATLRTELQPSPAEQQLVAQAYDNLATIVASIKPSSSSAAPPAKRQRLMKGGQAEGALQQQEDEEHKPLPQVPSVKGELIRAHEEGDKRPRGCANRQSHAGALYVPAWPCCSSGCSPAMGCSCVDKSRCTRLRHACMHCRHPALVLARHVRCTRPQPETQATDSRL